MFQITAIEKTFKLIYVTIYITSVNATITNKLITQQPNYNTQQLHDTNVEAQRDK